MGVLNTEVEVSSSSDSVTFNDSVKEETSVVRGDISVTMSGTDVDIHNSVVDASLGLPVDVVSVGKGVADSSVLEVRRSLAGAVSAGLVAIGGDKKAFVSSRADSGAGDKEVGVISIISATVIDMSDEIMEVIRSAVVSRVPPPPTLGSTMIVVSTSRRRFLFSSCLLSETAP